MPNRGCRETKAERDHKGGAHISFKMMLIFEKGLFKLGNELFLKYY